MAWIDDGGFVPLPRSIQRAKFFWDDRRFAFFQRLQVLKIQWQGQLIPWDTGSIGTEPWSLHSSIRVLARDLRLSRSSLHDMLRWFSANGYLKVQVSKRHGIVITVLRSEAFVPRYGHESGHPSDTASTRNQKRKTTKPKTARTTPGHNPGHLSGHPKSPQKPLKTAAKAAGRVASPDTFPDTNPDARSQDFRSLKDPRERGSENVDKSAKMVDITDLFDENARLNLLRRQAEELRRAEAAFKNQGQIVEPISRGSATRDR